MTNPRRQRALVLLLLAVLVLAPGSIAAARGAKTLTAKSVKKIATKVVRKQAQHLHVADADTVGGLAPAALQENRSVYTIPVPSGLASFATPLPLTPGSYEIAYAARLKTTVDTVTECYVTLSNGSTVLQFVADDGAASTTLRSAHSGVGVLTVAPGQTVYLGCDAEVGTFTTASNEPVQVVVTRLAGVTNQNLVAVPVT